MMAYDVGNVFLIGNGGNGCSCIKMCPKMILDWNSTTILGLLRSFAVSEVTRYESIIKWNAMTGVYTPKLMKKCGRVGVSNEVLQSLNRSVHCVLLHSFSALYTKNHIQHNAVLASPTAPASGRLSWAAPANCYEFRHFQGLLFTPQHTLFSPLPHTPNSQ